MVLAQQTAILVLFCVVSHLMQSCAKYLSIKVLSNPVLKKTLFKWSQREERKGIRFTVKYLSL